jgi:hypothetical protein
MSLNPTITQSPIVLFLGAGASVPLGKPTMEQFVARLADQITSENEASLLSVLISARGHDLEAILTDLETFLSLQYVTSFVFDRQNPSAYEANRSDAANLRSLIRHSIIREYRSIDTQRAVEVYQPLFDTIFSHVDPATCCLPIFTTNYDLAIESLGVEQFSEYDFIDGMEDDPFQRQSYWNPMQFESFRIGRQVRPIVLFKLHGSVNWMRITSTGRIVQSLPMYDVIDSDEYQNTIIYPAGNKVATTEPYLTGYHYFARCCEYAKIIVVIGYSFRDYDVLSSLLKARRINEDLKLILLSPNSYDVLNSIPDEDRICWAQSVYGYFGDKVSEAKYLQEIEEWFVRYVKK